MSDVAVAVWVACGLLAVFGAAMLTQSRQRASWPAPAPAIVPTGAPPAQIEAIAARMDTMEGHLKTTDHNVANVRTMVQALPSKEAVHRLEVELAALKGDVKLGNAEGLATARAVERIEHILMSSNRPHP